MAKKPGSNTCERFQIVSKTNYESHMIDGLEFLLIFMSGRRRAKRSQQRQGKAAAAGRQQRNSSSRSSNAAAQPEGRDRGKN
jgi:hypothetical protein